MLVQNEYKNILKDKALSFWWGVHSINIFSYLTFKLWNINYLYAIFGQISVIILYIVQICLVLFISIDVDGYTTFQKCGLMLLDISPTLIVFYLHYYGNSKINEFINNDIKTFTLNEVVGKKYSILMFDGSVKHHITDEVVEIGFVSMIYPKSVLVYMCSPTKVKDTTTIDYDYFKEFLIEDLEKSAKIIKGLHEF